MQEAADLLGTTVDGIRSRIKRGTLDSMKVGGQVFVLLGPDQSPPSPGLGETSPRPDPPSHDGEALLAAKDETIHHLRLELDARNEELRRKDHILAGLIERVPALEVPTDGRDPTPTSPDGREGGEEPRSWWRRLFGG